MTIETPKKSWFRRTPSPAAAPEPRGPEPARSVEERKEVLAALAAEQAAWSETVTRLDRRLEAAQTREAEAEALHREASSLRAEAHVARVQASFDHDHPVEVLRQRLRAGASESIDHFLWELLGEEERTRAAFDMRGVAGQLDLATLSRPESVTTNSESVERRLTAIRAVRVKAEALREAVLEEAEVRAELEALLSTIPDVERLEVDPFGIFTPAQLREIGWRAEGAMALRWSGQPWK